MRSILLRLSGTLTAVLGLWMLIWLPVAQGESSTATPGEHALGDPNAPVTIVEYASLTCPHCAQFHTDVLPELKEKYIVPGKVRLVYRDFPLDQRALEAAMLAECVGPDRYFGFLDVLFQTQSNWAQAEGLAELKGLGRLAGMSEEQMQQCLENQQLGDRILQTRLDAQDKYGVSSTPSFVIDGELHAGSRSVEDFSSLIDPLLEGS